MLLALEFHVFHMLEARLLQLGVGGQGNLSIVETLLVQLGHGYALIRPVCV